MLEVFTVCEFAKAKSYVRYSLHKIIVSTPLGCLAAVENHSHKIFLTSCLIE